MGGRGVRVTAVTGGPRMERSGRRMTEAEGKMLERLDRIEELLGRIATALEGKAVTTRKQPARPKTETGGGGVVWDMYSGAYMQRYGVAPVRNAKSNSLCARLVERLGTDAPQVADFYVRKHNDRLYLSARHVLDLLIRDAEKIRTDWKRGLAPTSHEAGNAEKLAYAKGQMERIARGEL